MIENPYDPFGLLRKLRRFHKTEAQSTITSQLVEAKVNSMLTERGLVNRAPQLSVDAHDGYYLVNIDLPEEFPAHNIYLNTYPIIKTLSARKGLTELAIGTKPNIHIPKLQERIRVNFILQGKQVPHVVMIKPDTGTGLTFKMTGSTCEVIADGSELNGFTQSAKDPDTLEFNRDNSYSHSFNGDGAFALAVLEKTAT